MAGQDEGSGGPQFPFTPQDALAFLTKMWNPLGVPMPGFGLPGATATPAPPGAAFPNPAAMFAALDPAEVERKIGELRVIENWLAMSLDMMRMSIKTLELQKASLDALAAAQRPMQEASRTESHGAAPRPPKKKG
jgi:hypothetical protein